MPIYEYRCTQTGEVTEMIMSLSEWDKRLIGCPIHNGTSHTAEKISSIPGNIQIASPTRIFVNPKTGEAQVATSNYEKPPHGYIDKELKGPYERSKFEKEERQRNHVIDEIDTYRMQQRREAHRKERHDHLRATMNATQVDMDEHGNEVRYHLEEKDKHMLGRAMQDSAKRRNVPDKRTENYLAVNHTDASNLQDAPRSIPVKKKRRKR